MFHRRALLAQILLSGYFSLLVNRREAFADNVQYEYDGLGRLARVIYGDGTTIVYTYDAAGNRVTLVQSPTPPAAPQGSLGANPSTINQGASSSLSWSSTNATTASIDNGIGSVTPVAGGSISVSPSSTTTYSLTLTGPGGQITRQATVTVNSPPPPPLGSLSANPASITQGNSSNLTWSSTNATSASIDNGVGPVTPVSGGSVSVAPSATTTYTLTLGGPGGQITRQATVTVTQPPGFNATIPVTGTGAVNLRTLADAAGYNGAQNATVIFTLASNVMIAATAGAPNGGVAIDTGSWPTGSFTIDLELQVAGKIYGGGGRGGTGNSTGAGAPGGAGGDAVYCRVPIDITVLSGGQIKGGGGGGGGGAYQLAGGGSVRVGGDGGGGGFPNGAGGAGSNGTAGDAAVAGAAGTASGGGLGGSGGGPVGGNGGNGGANGGSGASFSALGGVGGAGGYAVRKNGHTVNVTNNGTVAGTVG